MFNIFKKKNNQNKKNQLTLDEKWAIDAETYKNPNIKIKTGESQCYNCIHRIKGTTLKCEIFEGINKEIISGKNRCKYLKNTKAYEEGKIDISTSCDKEKYMKKFNEYAKDNYTYDLGNYTKYINKIIFGEGMINNQYLSLWKKKDLLYYNELYKVREYLDNILLIGSDGGDEAYGIDINGNYISVPFIPMDNKNCKIIAKSFEEFLNYLWNKE